MSIFGDDHNNKVRNPGVRAACFRETSWLGFYSSTTIAFDRWEGQKGDDVIYIQRLLLSEIKMHLLAIRYRVRQAPFVCTQQQNQSLQTDKHIHTTKRRTLLESFPTSCFYNVKSNIPLRSKTLSSRWLNRSHFEMPKGGPDRTSFVGRDMYAGLRSLDRRRLFTCLSTLSRIKAAPSIDCEVMRRGTWTPQLPPSSSASAPSSSPSTSITSPLSFFTLLFRLLLGLPCLGALIASK